MKRYEYISFLAPLIRQYEDFCIRTDNYSDGAFERIHYFDIYCKENAGDENKLSQSLVDSWFRKRDTEINNSCRSRSFPVIGFIRYGNQRKLLDIDIPDIPDGLPCSYVPHIFTDKELTKFFYCCDNLTLKFNNTPNIIRKFTVPVIFRTLYSTGMRTFETRYLKRNNVSFTNGVINIEKSKHNIQHYVVLHDSTLEMLKEYDKQIDSLLPEREYFFPGTGKYTYLTKDWICSNFSVFWKMVSDEYAKPYDFRHNYAINNVNSWTGDIADQFSKLVYLSKTMGHVTLNSTRYYYSYSSHMADLIREYTSSGMREIMPEVNYEDFK